MISVLLRSTIIASAENTGATKTDNNKINGINVRIIIIITNTLLSIKYYL